jgi:hypothetical protein
MRSRSQAIVAAVMDAVGIDELLLLTALGLIARGLWLAWRPGAYLVPGAILLWVVLPSRTAFLTRPPSGSELSVRKKI